jgi:hypothetical protein
MGDDSLSRGRAAGLTGRRGECDVLDRLLNAVRTGDSRVLVICGEAGVGKSALLDYLAGHAATGRLLRAVGVESEMELAFAGLHQLLAPVLDHLDRLPAPQREALRTAFGLSPGPARRCGSGIRWPGRRPTGRRQRETSGPRMPSWRRRPTRPPIPIAVHGTGRRLRPSRTRTWRPVS